MALLRRRPPGHRPPAHHRNHARRAALVIVLVGALMAPLTGLAPGAGAVPEAAPPDPRAAHEIEQEAESVRAQILELDPVVEAAAARLELAIVELADAEAELAERRVRIDDATEALRSYGVAAYLAGGRIPDGLIDEMLTSERHSADAEGQLMLVTLVHDHFVHDVRTGRAQLDESEQRLLAARVEHDEATAEHTEKTRAHAQLVESHAALTAAAELARQEEERVTAELIAREAELRAGVPPAQPVATGVVPPPTVPAATAAALGGIIGYTALDAYWRAAALANPRVPGCGIDWALIAAVGLVESRHGTYSGGGPRPDGTVFPVIIGIPLDGTRGTAHIRDTDGGLYDGDAVVDRAVGPMQFIPGTWARYASDGNGDGIADPHNIYDAALAAGIYLCHRGGGPLSDPGALSRAVHGYNRSWTYVGQVLATAEQYRALDPSTPQSPAELADATDAAQLVPASTTGDGDASPGSTTSSAPTTSSTVPVTSTTVPVTEPPVEPVEPGEPD